MKTMLAAATAALLMGMQPSSAQLYEGPWCAHVGIGDDSYVERCDMRSYEMCRTEIFEQGGAFCTQNTRYRPTTPEPKKLHRKAQERASR